MDLGNKFESKVSDLVHRLPPMPHSITRLMSTTESGTDETEKFVNIVKNDPGLCADLLHLANTFCSSSRGHDETIEEAIESVGIQPLMQLIGVWYANDMINRQFKSLTHLDEYFRHSSEISIGCRLIAEANKTEHHGRQVASVAGLIHDMGRLIIILAQGKTSASLMGTPWKMMKTIVSEERQILGMDHCRVGMYVAKKWNFPEFLQQGILRHHAPIIDSDFNYLGAMIFVAHFLTSSDFTGQTLKAMLPTELLDGLNITKEDFITARDSFFQKKSL